MPKPVVDLEMIRLRYHAAPGEHSQYRDEDKSERTNKGRKDCDCTLSTCDRMDMMDRVKDKVAIVTGGAQGIGRATCLLLAKEGAVAVVTDISEVNGKNLVEEIRSIGGMAGLWQLDVTDEKEVKAVFAAVHARLGRLDVLVNNAGIAGVNKPTHEITEEEWDKVIGINVKSVFFCTKHAIPHMQKGGGSIINLSSIYDKGDCTVRHSQAPAPGSRSRNVPQVQLK